MVKNRQFWSYYFGVTRLLISTVLSIACITAVAAQRPIVPPQEALALTNASVVNVRTGAVLRNATVVLRGGRIESVGTAAAPSGIRAIDLRGRHVVPGLIDAHVHIGGIAQMRAAL